MDWNPNVRNFVSRPDMASFNFLYSYNYDHYPGMDTKQAGIGDAVLGQGMMGPDINYGININGSSHEKKKRLTSEQLDSLENSFQEDIKLEPDRKMKLSRELGLQPRQIAVWFQNRRARWKAKQLERLYDSLKQEFDVVSKEKQKLLDEVMKLRGIIREQAVGGSRKQQVSTTGQTAEMSAGEETVESTSVAIGSYGINNNNNNNNKPIRSTAATTNQHQHGVIGMNGDHQQCCNYLLNLTVDHDHTNVNAAAVSTPYWALLPPNSYPLNN